MASTAPGSVLTRPVPAPAPAAVRAVSRHRPRGGSLRSGVLTASFAVLFVSGLFLWLRPGSAAVILAHAAVGLVAMALLVPWLLRHVPRMICHAQRPAFTWSSWALLGLWLALMLSGLAMALPAGLWLVGLVWFPAREWIEGLSLVHFWSSWAAMAGLGLHLSMRHWQLPPRDPAAGARK